MRPWDVNEFENEPSEKQINPPEEVDKKSFPQNYLSIASLGNLGTFEEEKSDSAQPSQWIARALQLKLLWRYSHLILATIVCSYQRDWERNGAILESFRLTLKSKRCRLYS